MLADALRVFRQRYPGVALELVGLTSAPQEEALAFGRVDVGCLYPPAESPDVAWETILEEPLVAVLPDSHRTAGRTGVPLADLSGEPFFMFPRRNRPALHDRIVAECRRAGFSPRVVQEVGDIQAVLGLVAAGFGVAPTLGSFAQLKRPGVAYLPLDEPTGKLALSVAWRRGDRSSALGNVLGIVREMALHTVERWP